MCMKGVIATFLTLARQPQGLSLKPNSTLFKRARQWLNDNHAAVEDEDQQLGLYVPVDEEFTHGPSKGYIDILIVTSDGA